jgi:ABC-type transport system involved in multi-copper enzyme maturation permease subunit
VNAVRAIAGSVVADALRRKVVYVVLVFAAFMAIAIPRLPSYGVGVVEAVFREVTLALMYVVAVVVVLALSANRVPGEVERRTVYNILGRDVRRWQYLLGSWLGVFAVMGSVIAAFSVVSLLVGSVTYHTVMWRLLEGALAIWLETGVIAAFAISVSTFTGPVPVAVASVAFLFVGHLGSGAAQEEMVQGAASASSFYPTLEAFNVINPVAHGSGISLTYVALMLVAAFAWTGALLVVGSLLFSRRDL